MTRDQRYRYEMFVRVRDFGVTYADRFREAAKAGPCFREIADHVAAIEAHLIRRHRARTEASGVKTATRQKVVAMMKDIARTGRRLTVGEATPNPFRLPERRTVAALLAAARTFIDEATPRQAEFVAFGLPPDFIRECRALVDQLDAAVVVRNNGRAWRRRSQTGIASAVRAGMEAVRHLDSIVLNVMRGDAEGIGHWEGARRIEGLRYRRVRHPSRNMPDGPPVARE